ncbi:MAG: hypothetical protein QM692_03155 [Thermomicrobiales bacterium]
MDADQFDALGRRLGASSTRRRSLGLVGALGVSGVGLANEASANKHKKKRKKKHKPQTTLPPAAPVAHPDASCSATGTPVSAVRNAQTFRALRSGLLTSATIYLVANASVVTLDIEIWSVDGTGQPSAVLAGATVANIAAGSTTRPISVTYAGPAQVTVGLRYAVVVTRTSGTTAQYDSAMGNPCPDGQNWFAESAAEPFMTDATFDLRFDTVVTA